MKENKKNKNIKRKLKKNKSALAHFDSHDIRSQTKETEDASPTSLRHESSFNPTSNNICKS